VVQVQQTEADCLQQHVNATRRMSDFVECQHGMKVERSRQNKPAERHTHQHVRYTNLHTRHSADTQCRHIRHKATFYFAKSTERINTHNLLPENVWPAH